MKRHLVLAALAAAVMTLVIAAREARSGDPASDGSTCAVPAANAPPGSVFWGCWSFFSSGPCRAVYRDTAGDFSLCGKCGPTGEPNPNGCSAISSHTLAIGFWCS